MANTTNDDREGIGETRRSSEQPVPNTRAPESGSPPAAGKVSPAEKSEPSGVPIEEQLHNADPNAPQHLVVAPGETEHDVERDGGVSATSRRDGPDIGSPEERRNAQIPNIPPPDDAGEGYSSNQNDPNESSPIRE
jgi:hypothetical protein